MMFCFSRTTIDVEASRASVTVPEAGAVAVFEGLVRNHQDGRSVNALEYEAYETLAVKEAKVILDEASSRFSVHKIDAVHRLGYLHIGDAAVIVSVSASHRQDAFAACRYVIDQIKLRLPIWKKEHYADGTAEWVNCAHEHQHVQSVPECGEFEVDVLALSPREISKFRFIDVREREESDITFLMRLMHADYERIPVSEFDVGRPPIDATSPYLLMCERGARSRRLVTELRARGYTNVFSVSGGVSSLRRKFIA